MRVLTVYAHHNPRSFCHSILDRFCAGPLGFAFAVAPAAWRGDVSGRVPSLTHKKALIINTTLFDRRAYEGGLGMAMKALIDEYSLHYPGVQSVEHVYFHAVHGADETTRRGYLDRAYALGRDFVPLQPASDGGSRA